jgi:peptidoglycan/xylan/chitin deacetylase (PgdA/CDA1 family)
MPLISLLCHDVYGRDPSETGFPGAAADRYKLTIAAFESMLAALAGALDDAPIRVPVLADPPDRGVMLTVDDGGIAYHAAIADRLEARGWRGHCFMSTGMIGRPGFLTVSHLRDLDERGHVIGTHSATHPTRFSSCSRRQMLAEWSGSRKTLEDVLGHAVIVGSLPGGYFSLAVAESARDAGLQWLFTSEPETRLRCVGDCTIAGRFTIRPGHPARFARDVVEGRTPVRQREWLQWHLKRMVKPVLGPAYPAMGAWLHGRRSIASAKQQGGVE